LGFIGWISPSSVHRPAGIINRNGLPSTVGRGISNKRPAGFSRGWIAAGTDTWAGSGSESGSIDRAKRPPLRVLRVRRRAAVAYLDRRRGSRHVWRHPPSSDNGLAYASPGALPLEWPVLSSQRRRAHKRTGGDYRRPRKLDRPQVTLENHIAIISSTYRPGRWHVHYAGRERYKTSRV
jgi:hypothetical protein